MRLHVNIDHVATVRNARGTTYPDPIHAAKLAEKAGADGITAHLREDRRHIRDADMIALRNSVSTLLNMEMAVTDEMVGIACDLRPDVVTLVPERREERTTEGGLDVLGQSARIETAVGRLRAAGIKVSLFIEPSIEQISASHQIGVQQIELHTGEYCLAAGEQQSLELARLRRGATLAQQLGLEVAAGHGLSVSNLVAVAAIPAVAEMNIGHALIADALFLGLEASIAAFRDAIRQGEALRSSHD
jgi:pyridoxine 5-phosphate synthase